MNNIFIDQLWTAASENEKLSFFKIYNKGNSKGNWFLVTDF